jgi:hypothetical protein
MENLTLVQLRDFGIVALALLAFIVLIGNVVKTIREWRRPGQTVAAWRREMDDSMKDNSDRIKKVEDGNKVIMKALIAMMNHEINGNSVDKLQKALGELNDYLIDNI